MSCLRTASLLLSLACMSLLGGCGSNTASNSFKNSLTFGTGLGGTGFDLIGENTTFSIAVMGSTGQIYFRLESAADMGGQAVRLYFNDGLYQQKDYSNPQSYGHIFLSSFRITDVGTYTVKGYLVEQVGPDIGKETLVASSNITMQP